MEPKVKSTGHGHYALYYWSYMDQVWKHLRGTKDPTIPLKQQLNYWKHFYAHVKKRLSKICKVETAHETVRHVIFSVFIDGRLVKIVFRKSDLLHIKITPLTSGEFDEQPLMEACRRCVLDEDFYLTK